MLKIGGGTVNRTEELKIIDIDELIPYVNNARTHSKEQIEKIDSTIKDLGIANEWRFTKEHHNYIVFDNGVIASICKEQMSRYGNFIRRYELNFLKGSQDRYGYRTIRMAIDGRRKHIKTHRIVANAFIPNPENKKEVNHINGDKQDNRVENLEWTTRAENNAHAIRTGLLTFKRGYWHPNSKISPCDVMTIYILHRHLNVPRKELAKNNKVSRTTIDNLINDIDKIMRGVI